MAVALNFMPIDPIKALYWSAVINGVLAAPVMGIMMVLVRKTNSATAPCMLLNSVALLICIESQPCCKCLPHVKAGTRLCAVSIASNYCINNRLMLFQ